MKSDLKYVSSTEEEGDVCSHLDGVIKAQAASLQTNLRSKRYCSPELRLSSLLCLCIYTASLCRLACFYIDCGFSEGPGKEGSGLGGAHRLHIQGTKGQDDLGQHPSSGQSSGVLASGTG